MHDYLYWRAYCTKEQTDNLLFMAMEDAEVRRFVIGVFCAVMWSGFSQLGWNFNVRDRKRAMVRVVPPPFDTVPAGVSWPEYRAWAW
jgi:hypothetical protein